MNNKFFITLTLLVTLILKAGAQAPTAAKAEVLPWTDSTGLILPGEKHFASIRQLTFGGDNAEAYFSNDGKRLTFQRTDHKEVLCDQIYTGVIPYKGDKKFEYSLLSNGTGRTTCSFFMPGDTTILYASTFEGGAGCPAVPDRHKIGKYVWPIYDTYEIYVADLKGNIKKQLTKNNFYDAEGTVSPKGDKIVFTSTRDGDLDIYTMNLDGTNIKRITNTLGYDGGAAFSADGTKILWRASRPKTEAEIKEYNELYAQGMVAPTNMKLFVANADGSDAYQVVDLPAANWAPYFFPDGKKIIFSSNHESERGFPFSLYMINLDGTGIEKITTSDTFDAFPMFSPDGKYLLFCSNRNNGGTHDTNVFIARWKD